jgi:hypothetical protein
MSVAKARLLPVISSYGINAIAGHHEAVAFAATPFAGPIAQRPARYPAVVGQSLRGDRDERNDDEQASQKSGHGKIPFIVPAISRRGDRSALLASSRRQLGLPAPTAGADRNAVSRVAFLRSGDSCCAPDSME